MVMNNEDSMRQNFYCILRNISGQVRVEYEAAFPSTGGVSQIYINDVPVGEMLGENYIPSVQDFTVNPGDKIAVWGKRRGGATWRVKYFRIGVADSSILNIYSPIY